ncbi:hypothetical protein [Klebsiella phage 05F01]|nr:hypothetical protein [Klebsiella phage 05F01]
MEAMISSQKSIRLGGLAYMLLETAAKEKCPFAYKENIKSFESQPDSFTFCGVIYVKEEEKSLFNSVKSIWESYS